MQVRQPSAGADDGLRRTFGGSAEGEGGVEVAASDAAGRAVSAGQMALVRDAG